MEMIKNKTASPVTMAEYNELKTNIHNRLVDILDLSLIDRLERGQLRAEIRRLTERILTEDGFRVPLNAAERERLYNEILDEVLGLGPIEPFMHDPTVSDILVNTYNQIYVERYGKLYPTDVKFKDDEHLR
ncbi:MAG TPA: CpaF family protein, partial [Syntrophales bacterium]|nr:CpaF family protein [Syntrophales bacterium]